MKKVTSLLLLAGVAAFGLAGCGDDDEVIPPDDDATIESVSVTPSEVTVEPGQTAQVRVDFQTSGGVEGISVEWTSGNTDIATVDPTGDQTAQVTGQSSGTATVTATVSASNAQSQSASAGVEVAEIEDASLSIGEITNQNGNPVNVSNVSGQINVAIDVDKGDETPEQVALLLDGETVSTQDFAAGNVETTTVKGQGEVERVVFSFRTDRLEGSTPDDVITADNADLDGNVKNGQFPNGEHTVSAELTTASGATRTATNSQTLTFNNGNLALTDHLAGGQGVVEPVSGARYWGGEDIQVSITPVVFDGTSVGSVTISANAGSQTGTGNGSIVFDSPTVSGEPFVFDILQADNAGGIEDARSAPDGPGGFGSDFAVGDIRDADGAAVLGQFSTTELNDFFLDFDAPDQSGSVEFGGVTTAVPSGNVHYSGFQGNGTVPIILPGVSDDGVGGTFSAPSDNFNIDVIDGSTPSSASTLFSDVSATWMLDEQAPSGSGGATDHFAHVTDLADNLGNGVTFSGGGLTVTTPVGDFGIDFTAPEKSNQLPADATGASQTGFVFNADGSSTGVLSVDLADPALANGETPSGLQNDGSTPSFEIQDDSENVLDSGTATDAGGGTFTADPSTTADGPQFAFIAFNDLAEPVNGDSQSWFYIKDTTAPTFGALNPAPQSTATQASSVLQDIGGTIDDANEIASAVITVRADFDATTLATSVGDHDDGDATDGAADGDGVCETSDELLDTANGDLVTGNNRDVTNGTSSIDFDETFEINDPFPSSSSTVIYCYFVTATDEALDNNGDPAGNPASLNTESEIEWQN